MGLHTITAAATASKNEFMPYFNRTIELLRPYMVHSNADDILELRHHAIDCLSEVGVSVGRENFMPIAKDAIAFVLELLDGTEDPDDKRAIYGLLSNMAIICNEELADIFPKVIPKMIESIVAANQILIKDDSEDPKNTDEDIEIDISNSDEESDDEEDGDIFNTEESYLHEKEEAISALSTFAKHCGAVFLPYLEISYKNIYEVLDHPSYTSRDTAAEALTTLIVIMIKLENTETTMMMLSTLMHKYDHFLHHELKLDVALCIVECVLELLKTLGPIIGENEHLVKMIANIINDVLLMKLKCQFNEGNMETEETEEPEDSAYEFSLIETAGDLLPALGKAMGSAKFVAIFDRFCPLLLDKWKKSKSTGNDENYTRFFVMGVLADCFKCLGNYTANYFDVLYPVFVKHMKDRSARVRQNTYYGMGELVFHSGEKSHASFPSILMELSECLSSETKPSCMDNICGTICRIILTNHNLVPLGHVLPVLFQQLPLKEDFAENGVLVQAWKYLLLHARDTLLVYYEQMVKIALQILARNQYENDEIKQNTIDLLLELRIIDGNKFGVVVSQNQNDASILDTL